MTKFLFWGLTIFIPLNIYLGLVNILMLASYSYSVSYYAWYIVWHMFFVFLKSLNEKSNFACFVLLAKFENTEVNYIFYVN